MTTDRPSVVLEMFWSDGPDATRRSPSSHGEAAVRRARNTHSCAQLRRGRDQRRNRLRSGPDGHSTIGATQLSTVEFGDGRLCRVGGSESEVSVDRRVPLNAVGLRKYPSISRMWLLSAVCALSSQISRSAVLDGHLSSEREHDRASRREEWRGGRDARA
jgi:hypothetical protein